MMESNCSSSHDGAPGGALVSADQRFSRLPAIPRLGKLVHTLLLPVLATAFCLPAVWGAAVQDPAGSQKEGTESAADAAVGSDSAVDLRAIEAGFAASDRIWLDTGFSKPVTADEWTLLGGGWKEDPATWPGFLSLAVKASQYRPPVRSPTHLALWNTPIEGDFVLDAVCRSTHPEYGHQDVCFFLGHTDDSHFYYVHLARAMDPHAHQIFLVNGADRTAISQTTTEGVNWGKDWHHVRIERRTSRGTIQVWFDAMDVPVMTAQDSTLCQPGRVGVGSFDDTADFLRLRVAGLVSEDAPVKSPAAAGVEGADR